LKGAEVCVVENDFEESGYIDMETRKITLPKRAYRYRRFYMLNAFMPCLIVTGMVLREYFLRGAPLSVAGTIALASIVIVTACLGWVFYTSMMSKVKFKYLSHLFISKLLMDDAFREAESEKAKAAASVRHDANRKRIAEAREWHEGREWPTKAAAARALAAKFHVTPKTAERWISSWSKD
jgi:hypothetical protein